MSSQDIKKWVETPKNLKPNFAWSELKASLKNGHPMPRIQKNRGVFEFDSTKILEGIGAAITDARLARGLKNPFTDKTKAVVLTVAQCVMDKLVQHPEKVLESEDMHSLIEEALDEHREFLAAKGYILYRTLKKTQQTVRKNLRVIRRTGQAVPWIPEKIETAIRKGFIVNKLDSSPAVGLTEIVVAKVLRTGKNMIHIEEIQDLVEETLLEAGHTKVARSYISYRAERTALRKLQERPSEIQTDLIDAELLARVEFASINLTLPLSREAICQRLVQSMTRNLDSEDRKKTIILNSKNLVELDPDFARFAARILLTYIYEEVLDWKILEGAGKLKPAHQAAFKAYIAHGIEIKRIDPRLASYNLDVVAEAIDPFADLDFEILGIQSLYDRYLIHENKRRIETPQMFWMRVAMGLAINEKEKEVQAVQFYELYRTRRFCSSTPTLFNSGSLRPQLSSCYLLYVDDSIEGIFSTITKCSYLSKWAGGLGVAWTAVRGMGSHISGTNGDSQGVIPFLKIYNDTLVAVNQGGKRKGAGCAYIETWHNDMLEFLELRRNTGDDRRRCHDMNTANWIPDLFMQRLQEGKDWTLFRSAEVPDLNECYGKEFKKRYEAYEKLVDEGKLHGDKMPAKELWRRMLTMLFETGHPWVCFKDPCNIRSPQDHAGVVHSSNLCTEITLNTSPDETAVCNLGSINLAIHLTDDGRIDEAKLRETVRTAVRMLDNVIDINYYPTECAKNSNLKHRPIGLGVMGLQDALHKKGIAFDSAEAVAFNDEFMELVAFHAYTASSRLAKERGSYPSFKGSKWDRGLLPLDTLELLEQERGSPIDVDRTSRLDWDSLRQAIRENGMRNSNVLAIAPTATISNIMGCSPCIEPDYKHLFVKSNLSGEFTMINEYLVDDLKKAGLWDEQMRHDLKYFDGELLAIDRIPGEIKDRFKTAFEIDPQWLIRAAAVRQKWIDQSQSVNLFLADPDARKLNSMYRLAWQSGLKTTYYLRTQAASAIEKATVEVQRKKDHTAVASSMMTTVTTTTEVKACLLNDPTCEACQ
jgi:ribonucleoside-diphosphate reductase alpha chain